MRLRALLLAMATTIALAARGHAQAPTGTPITIDNLATRVAAAIQASNFSGVNLGAGSVTPAGAGSPDTIANAIGARALKAANLSDLPDESAARVNLGLGALATLGVGSNLTASGGALSLTSGGVTGALGFTPFSAAGGTLTGPLTAPGITSTGTIAGNVTATGGMVAQTMPGRAASHMTVEDFGAKGDCTTDDTAAFNAYSTYLRGLTGYESYRGFNLGNSRCYILNGSVNLTFLNNTIFNGHGSVIIGKVNGKAVLDATETSNAVFKDFTLISGGTPLVGLQIGVALNSETLPGHASNNFIQNVSMNGTFTEADVYNRGSEITNFINDRLNNQSSGANGYALIEDGDAHWQIISDFASTYNPGNPTVADELYPAGKVLSFNENRIIGGSLTSYYGSPVWMSNTRGNGYVDTYVSASSRGSAKPAIVVYFGDGDTVNDLLWKVHSEGTLSSDILISGTQASPTINGLIYHNHIEMTGAGASVLALDTGVTSATINNLDFSIPQWHLSQGRVFDNGVNWTLNGRAATTLGVWNTPNFTGVLNLGGQPTYNGSLVNAALPTSVNVESVSSSGSVTGMTVTNSSSNAYYGGTIPTVAISQPPSGGSQALAAVSDVGLVNFNNPAAGVGGTGYAANDVVTFADGACATPIKLKVATVDGNGVPLTLTGDAVVGDCPASEMMQTAIATSGGAGTGLKINGTFLNWRIIAAAITAGGGGYTAAPAVTFSPGINPATNTAAATAAIGNGSLTVSSGTGSAVFSASGVALTGGVSVDSLKVGSTAGATCSGAPTASFATINGVITHC